MTQFYLFKIFTCSKKRDKVIVPHAPQATALLQLLAPQDKDSDNAPPTYVIALHTTQSFPATHASCLPHQNDQIHRSTAERYLHLPIRR